MPVVQWVIYQNCYEAKKRFNPNATPCSYNGLSREAIVSALGTDTQLDLVLYPHRSLKPEHFSILLRILMVLCILGSIRFYIVGAWPVVIFLVLDLLALWFAFYLNYRRARVREVIKLTEASLIVERYAANGKMESWQFEPYWTKVNIRKIDRYRNELSLSLHQQTVVIGSFLLPGEKRKLKEKLETELYIWKNRSPNQPGNIPEK
nr:DUF2244 domain-containing protein [Kordiimonas laminariae]